jgi:hypothetical protein
VLAGGGLSRLAPSGLVGSLADIARAMAAELRPRLDRPCEVVPAEPADPCDEPTVRVNGDRLDLLDPAWPTARSWDRYATFSKSEHTFSLNG